MKAKSPNSIFASFIALTLVIGVGLMSRSAQATGGVSEVLMRPVFRLVLQATPQGVELASRLLGRELSAVGSREYGEVLAALEQPANDILARDVAARVSTIESEAALESVEFSEARSRFARLQAASSRELGFAGRMGRAGAESGEAIRFMDGPVHTISRGGYSVSRHSFLAESSAQGMSSSWASLDLRPSIRNSLARMRDANTAVLRARMAMRLDGSAGALARLGEVMSAFRQAAARLSETSRAMCEAGAVTDDEATIFARQASELADLDVTREARSYARDARPAEFNAEVTSYLQAVRETARARGALADLSHLSYAASPAPMRSN